jgi:hypothetical protein
MRCGARVDFQRVRFVQGWRAAALPARRHASIFGAAGAVVGASRIAFASRTERPAAIRAAGPRADAQRASSRGRAGVSATSDIRAGDWASVVVIGAARPWARRPRDSRMR